MTLHRPQMPTGARLRWRWQLRGHNHPGGEDTYQVSRVREIRRLRRRVRVGAPDPSLTPVSGMVAVTELVDRLNMIRLLDAVIEPIKARGRGFTGGQLLVGLAAAQLAGEDVATWAQTATTLAADLMAGNENPRGHAADLLGRALAALPAAARAGRVLLRADAGYFAGALARAALVAGVEFAIGAKRIAPPCATG